MRSDAIFLKKIEFCLSHYAALKVREGEPSRPNTAHFRATKTSTGKTGTTRQKVSVISSKEVISLERR